MVGSGTKRLLGAVIFCSVVLQSTSSFARPSCLQVAQNILGFRLVSNETGSRIARGIFWEPIYTVLYPYAVVPRWGAKAYKLSQMEPRERLKKLVFMTAKDLISMAIYSGLYIASKVNNAQFYELDKIARKYETAEAVTVVVNAFQKNTEYYWEPNYDAVKMIFDAHYGGNPNAFYIDASAMHFSDLFKELERIKRDKGLFDVLKIYGHAIPGEPDIIGTDGIDVNPQRRPDPRTIVGRESTVRIKELNPKFFDIYRGPDGLRDYRLRSVLKKNGLILFYNCTVSRGERGKATLSYVGTFMGDGVTVVGSNVDNFPNVLDVAAEQWRPSLYGRFPLWVHQVGDGLFATTYLISRVYHYDEAKKNPDKNKYHPELWSWPWKRIDRVTVPERNQSDLLKEAEVDEPFLRNAQEE